MNNHVYRKGKDGNPIYPPTSQAVAFECDSFWSARLIAAAPEMYEALHRLINCHTGAPWQTIEVQRAAWMAARAALDKAEGND